MLAGLTPGDRLRRRDVHARYGGRQQGGIAPSRETPVVMFFTDPSTGHQHGYYDGWDEAGLFNYVGEGQKGDQRFVQGNKSIQRHHEEGRSLEGFLARGTEVTYLGEFKLVDTYFRDAHETGDESTLRQVIVFRLQPLGPVPVELPSAPITPTDKATVDQVPVEEQHTERSFVTPSREPYEMERTEAALVQRYHTYLLSIGHTVSRLRVVPPGEGAPLYSDLWDQTSRELIEAKASVTRDQVRQAVGQLLDYGRFAKADKRSLLVPSRPRPDLLAYLRTVGIDVIYPDSDGWARE
ncbi:restriction endonuclease [Actinomycetes bacterium KLBMP 9797]